MAEETGFNVTLCFRKCLGLKFTSIRVWVFQLGKKMASDLCLAYSTANSQKFKSGANPPSLSELSDNAKRGYRTVGCRLERGTSEEILQTFMTVGR